MKHKYIVDMMEMICKSCRQKIYVYPISGKTDKTAQHGIELGGNIYLQCPHCGHQYKESEVEAEAK